MALFGQQFFDTRNLLEAFFPISTVKVSHLLAPVAHVTDHVWTWEELVGKIDADERERKSARQSG
jgi:hypothetical protein